MGKPSILSPGGLPAPQACDSVVLASPHRLRKNLKSLIIVHPSWFIRTVLAISRPFIRWDPPGAVPCVCSAGRSVRFH